MIEFRQQSGEITANLNAALKASRVGPPLIRASIAGSGEPARVARRRGLEVEATGFSGTQGPDRKERPVRRLRSVDSRSLGWQRGLPPHGQHHNRSGEKSSW